MRHISKHITGDWLKMCQQRLVKNPYSLDPVAEFMRIKHKFLDIIAKHGRVSLKYVCEREITTTILWYVLRKTFMFRGHGFPEANYMARFVDWQARLEKHLQLFFKSAELGAAGLLLDDAQRRKQLKERAAHVRSKMQWVLSMCLTLGKAHRK